jgi:hypothetical protein
MGAAGRGAAGVADGLATDGAGAAGAEGVAG